MIALRAKAQDRRYRSLLAIVLVVLGLLVVWEHTGTEQGHADHGHVGEVVSVCMAVLSGAVALLGFSGLLQARPRPLPVRVSRPTSSRPRPVPFPRSRAGPTRLQVLLH